MKPRGEHREGTKSLRTHMPMAAPTRHILTEDLPPGGMLDEVLLLGLEFWAVNMADLGRLGARRLSLGLGAKPGLM